VRLVWDLELTLHGLTWGDFAFRVGDETDALMRAALVDLWKEEGLSGLSGFEPVEITRARVGEASASIRSRRSRGWRSRDR